MRSQEKTLKFTSRTAEISIDLSRCIAPRCGFACVKADRLYGRSVLKIQGGKPTLAVSREEVPRLCNECLACEIHCRLRGSKVVRISVPLSGLDEYRKKTGIST